MEAEVQEGIFITEINCIEEVTGTYHSTINSCSGTMMSSTINLSNVDMNSHVTYEITIYNNTIDAVEFRKVVYDDNFYDNDSIIYELDGLKERDVLDTKKSITFRITFKYKTGIIPSNNTLNAYLNFKFAPKERTLYASGKSATSPFLHGTLSRQSIESVVFKTNSEAPNNFIGNWGICLEEQDDIMAYYADVDGNGLYEVTVVSDYHILANENSAGIFNACSKLKNIDLSGLDTKNVTNAYQMFRNCDCLVNLDLSNMDTSNVTITQSMFEGCSTLSKINLENADFSAVTNYTDMLKDVPITCEILVKNEMAKNWFNARFLQYINVSYMP